MRLSNFIKNKMRSFLGIEATNDNNDRLTFISDEEAIIYEKVHAFRVWYYGNSSELLDYYTRFEVKNFGANPIYNRNKRNYFWGLSSVECDIKRVHSGLPKAMVDVICNIVDYPTFDCKDKDLLYKIFDYNNFYFKLKQQARPLTLVEGWGAYKINIRPSFKHPIIEYYEADNVEFAIDNGIITGLLFKNYYYDENKNKYILLESRHIETRKDNKGKYHHDCVIEYNLFKLGQKDELIPANYSDVGLNKNNFENQVFEDFDEMFAVPSRYYYDIINGEKYGRSFYDGIVDIFDDLDECLSIASRTNRVSTPVEYFDAELLERDSQGNAILPKRWNRDYIAKEGLINSDGGMNSNAGIMTTQPKLDFQQYNDRAIALTVQALQGKISPSTMGMELSRKDNANAQREKEKITLITRNNIINQETPILVKLSKLLLMAQEYLDKGKITNKDYEISVRYNEFAVPTYEEELVLLSKALTDGAISPEEYVERLYRDKKTKEEKDKEIKYIKEQIALKNLVYTSMGASVDGSNKDSESEEETNNSIK